ncbi:HAUS augmin-like complex subunit 6 N-terminus-domain-containing protein [Mucor mucedo]|uniref:HAUS augmin-like complex subunit 6 N-terminus-domain-containing protein n=1 Tax=Mucor mucedo TaxID=29922 RepID=UPI002220CCD3|nr:HAUS augmin-like complex subunit 6 N-terminus-domain-containing protein [Mucor mucedo]KAI7896013.1 HAUS augmin-like complex subunit 6 N-terminus-domain-containing protein [Mucor mucedo]
MSRKSIRSSTASTFVRNLHLLGFEPPRNSKWVVSQQTFTVNADSIKAFEHISYFLFNILDKKKAKTTFMEVWPIKNVKQSREYRRLAFHWLKDIQPGTHLVNAPLRVSYFTDCRGKPFNEIVSAFTALVMDKQPKDNTDVATGDSYSTKTTQDPTPRTADKRSTMHRSLTTEVLPRKKTRTQAPVDSPKSSLNITPPTYPRALSHTPPLQHSPVLISSVPSSSKPKTSLTCPRALSHIPPFQRSPTLISSVPSSSKPQTSPTFKSRIPSEERSLISSSLSSIDSASSAAYHTPPSSTDFLLSSKSAELASSKNNHLPPSTESPLPPSTESSSSPSMEAPQRIIPPLEYLRFSSFMEKVRQEELAYKQERARREKERYKIENLRNFLLMYK